MINSSFFHTFKFLEKFPLVQGYVERSMGSMSFDKESQVPLYFLDQLQIDVSALKFMNQTHGDKVQEVNTDSPLITENVDGLVTKTKGIILGVKTADCLPLIFYDAEKHIVSACHAGYKGLLVGSIQQTIDHMIRLGSNARDVVVGIGPSICGSCYNVTEDRIQLFIQKYPLMTNIFKKDEKEYFLDLRQVAVSILETKGITRDRIEFSPFCTKEDNEKFFSRRVEARGVFLTIIGML